MPATRLIQLPGNWNLPNWKIVVRDDFYVSLRDGSSQFLWKWDRSSPFIDWIQNHENNRILNFLPLSSNKVFTGFRLDSSDDYFLLKLDFGNSGSIDWKHKVSCPTSSWSDAHSSSIISSSGNKIYTTFTFGSKYIFYTLNITNGNQIGQGIMRDRSSDEVYSILEANGNLIFILSGQLIDI